MTSLLSSLHIALIPANSAAFSFTAIVPLSGAFHP